MTNITELLHQVEANLKRRTVEHPVTAGEIATNDTHIRLMLALPQFEADARDAARWRALLASERIRVLGSAGLMADTDPNGRPYNGYAHLGLEIWTKFSKEGYSQKLQDDIVHGNATGIEWLTKYVDIAVKEQTK